MLPVITLYVFIYNKLSTPFPCCWRCVCYLNQGVLRLIRVIYIFIRNDNRPWGTKKTRPRWLAVAVALHRRYTHWDGNPNIPVTMTHVNCSHTSPTPYKRNITQQKSVTVGVRACLVQAGHKTLVLRKSYYPNLRSEIPWTPLELISPWNVRSRPVSPAPPRLRQIAVNRRKQRSAADVSTAGESGYVANYMFNSHARNELLRAAMVYRLGGICRY